MTFHELCATLTARASLAPPPGTPAEKLYDEVLPELLMQAYERLNDDRYDALIIDEGQDFLPLWWTAVQECLDPDGLGLLRIFYDDNQRVYTSASDLPQETALIPIRLSLNLRNTRRIHELVRQHYTGHEIEAVGPEGVEVRWIRTSTPGQIPERISDCVTRLCSLEHVPPDHIAVLAATTAETDIIAPNGRLAGHPATTCTDASEGCLVLDTIRRFKGLERPVVVIAASPESVISDELPYVALSRARTHLVIAGTDSVLDRLRGAIPT